MTSPWDPVAASLKAVARQFGDRAIPSIVVGSVYNPEVLAEWLLAKDQEHAEAIGAAVEAFGRTGQWPELSPELRLLLHLRARHALLILGQLCATLGGEDVVVPNGSMAPADLFLWLMCAWPENFRLSLPAAARELLRP